MDSINGSKISDLSNILSVIFPSRISNLENIDNRDTNNISLNKLLIIFEIVDKIDSYDNRGTFDFLTAYQFILENISDNPYLGVEISNMLKERILHVFISTLWYDYATDKEIFSKAIKIGTGLRNSLTTKEIEAINLLIKELNNVFNEEVNLKHVDIAVNAIKQVIQTKMISEESSTDVDEFSNRIKVRLWVKPGIISRLLFFKVCIPEIIPNVLKKLPYGIIKNEKEFLSYDYKFSKRTFELIIRAFDFDVASLCLKVYAEFLNKMKYRESSIDRSKQFFVSMLPNYDQIWSRLCYDIHPRKVEQLVDFHSKYIISEEEIIQLICH